KSVTGRRPDRSRRRSRSGGLIMKRCLWAVSVCGILLAASPSLEGDDSEAQARAIERVKNLGGKYVAEKDDPDGPAVVVYFESTRVKDADLALLKDLPETTHLDLTTTEISDAGLFHVQGLRKLQVLGLTRTKVTGAGLEHVKGCAELKALFLRQTKVTDKGLV